MPIINKGTAFSNGEQLTADKINNLLDLATFNQSATDSASTTVNSASQIVVADSGITTAKLATDAVTTAKLATDAVTTSKIKDANVTFAKLTDVIDDDTMATATDTTLATSKSIKAYVDSITIGVNQTWQVFSTSERNGGVSYQNTTGKPIMIALRGTSNSNPSAQVSQDGSNWISIGTFVDSQLGYSSASHISFIVPNEVYYRITADISNRTWAELR